MNRPHPIAARGATADRIAAAYRGATIVSRKAFGAAVLSLLLTGASPAGAACPDDGGDAIASACAADAPAAAATASGAASTESPAAPNAADAAPDEGQRELLAAKKAIEDGERAPDDDARKRAYEEAKRHAD